MKRLPSVVEWATIVLVVVIYGLWLALTWFHAAIPWPLLLIAGACVIAWHGSLQHELIHGHPTPWPTVPRAFGLPPLALFLPVDRFSATHLAHHRDERLTDPLDDPETHYWTPAQWQTLSPAGRMIVRCSLRLAGRVVIGPIWSIARFLHADTERFARDEPGVRAAWLWHLPLLMLVLVWLHVVCGMSLLTYALCFVMPGCALLQLRAFAEHRAAAKQDHRTAVVEHAPVLGLLFLFNNLHVAHHERPGLPWYRLPGWYAQERERLLRKNGALVYRGYADVMRRFLLRPHDSPIHPLWPGPVAGNQRQTLGDRDELAAARHALRSEPGLEQPAH